MTLLFGSQIPVETETLCTLLVEAPPPLTIYIRVCMFIMLHEGHTAVRRKGRVLARCAERPPPLPCHIKLSSEVIARERSKVMFM